MKKFTTISTPEVVDLLVSGHIGVIRTDTLYGIVGRADDERVVDRIFTVKNRSSHKSPIVLISSVDDLYDTPLDTYQPELRSLWPGKVSIILPSRSAPEWIRRENRSVAYRLPESQELQDLCRRTGRLVAPSANPEDKPPARSIDEAVSYFGDKIDFYVDGGKVHDNQPSRLISLDPHGKVTRLR